MYFAIQQEHPLMPLSFCRYMRPNTPHAVVTPTSSICYGGHYLATSCLRETCSGFLLTFVLGTLISNTESTTDTQLLLRQMAYFFYEAYSTSDVNCEQGRFFSSSLLNSAQVYRPTPWPTSRISPTLTASLISFHFATCLSSLMSSTPIPI